MTNKARDLQNLIDALDVSLRDAARQGSLSMRQMQMIEEHIKSLKKQL